MLRYRAVPGRVYYWMKKPNNSYFVWLVVSRDNLFGWHFINAKSGVPCFNETFTISAGDMVENFGNQDEYSAMNAEEWV